VMISFLILYSIQIFSVFKAVSFVELKSFNLQRAELVIGEYLITKRIPNPQEISKRELIFYNSKIIINPPLKDVIHQKQEMTNFFNEFSDDKFLILTENNDKYNIIYFKEAEVKDVLKGLFVIHQKMNKIEKSEQLFVDFYEALQLSEWNLEVEHVEKTKNRISVEFNK
jgi:hypothetical protein